MNNSLPVVKVNRSVNTNYRLVIDGDLEVIELINRYKSSVVYKRVKEMRMHSHEVALSNYGGFRDYHTDLSTLVALSELSSRGEVVLEYNKLSLFDVKILSSNGVSLHEVALLYYVEFRWLINVVSKIVLNTFIKICLLSLIFFRFKTRKKITTLKISYASRWNHGDKEDKLGFSLNDNIGLFVVGDASMPIPNWAQCKRVIGLLFKDNWQLLDNIIMPWTNNQKWNLFQSKTSELLGLETSKYLAANIWEYYQFSLRDSIRLSTELKELHFDKFEMPIGKAIAFSGRQIDQKIGYQHSYLGEMVDINFALLNYWDERYLPNTLLLEKESLQSLLKTKIKVKVVERVYRLRHLNEVKRNHPDKIILFMGIRDDFKIINKALTVTNGVIYVKFHPKGRRLILSDNTTTSKRLKEFCGTTIEALSQVTVALIGNTGIYQETEYLKIKAIKL